MRSQLEAHYGMELPRDSAVAPWLINYAADTINRHQLGEDGKTAYQRLRGRPFRGTLVHFGECVDYLAPGATGHSQWNYKWGVGIWLGLDERSGGNLIGTSTEVVAARSIRRKAGEERWQNQEFRWQVRP